MTVLNLTQHDATTDQLAAGVVDLPNDVAPIIRNILTFDQIPGVDELRHRAESIARIAAELASGEDRNGGGFALQAMIGGAPFFMSALEHALMDAGIQPVYAFSIRDSLEKPDANGGVRKINVFRHIGFVTVS